VFCSRLDLPFKPLLLGMDDHFCDAVYVRGGGGRGRRRGGGGLIVCCRVQQRRVIMTKSLVLVWPIINDGHCLAQVK